MDENLFLTNLSVFACIICHHSMRRTMVLKAPTARAATQLHPARPAGQEHDKLKLRPAMPLPLRRLLQMPSRR